MSFKFIVLFAVLIAGAVGYYLWDQVPETPKAQTFSGYTQGLQSSEQKAEAVASLVNVKGVQGSVDKYKTDKGTLPPTLQDLVPSYMDHIPGGLQYDAATGTVSASQ